MTPTQIPHLDALAAQNASILVDAAELVKLRDELEALRAENQKLRAWYERVSAATADDIYEWQ
jgi:cell division protein FtsB